MATSKATKRKTSPKSHFPFRPCGPIRAMIANEMRGNTKDRSRIIQELICKGGAAKYPKLAARFQILMEEKSA